MGQQFDARRRWLRPAADPLDQPNPHPLFQQFHLQADGRLRQARSFGSSRKATEIDDADEGGKLVEIQNQKNSLWIA